MNITQPVYSLSININNCDAEIWCNNIILFEFKPISTQNQGLSITIPINHLLLKQGEFEIRATISPSFRKETLLKSSFVVLQLSVNSNINNKNSIPLLKLKTPDATDALDKKNPIKIENIKTMEGLPNYELLGAYKDKILPFEEIGWTKSVNLVEQNPQTLLVQAFEFFKNIETIINNSLIHQFIEINESKNKLLKETLYLTNKQYEKCKIDDVTLLIHIQYH